MTDRRGWGGRLHPYPAEAAALECSFSCQTAATPANGEGCQWRGCCRVPTENEAFPCRVPLILYLLSQAFRVPSPPRGSGELSEPLQTPSSAASIARSSTHSSQLLGGEMCGFTHPLFAAWRAWETCSHAEKDRSAPASSWFVLRSNHKTFSQNLSFP